MARTRRIYFWMVRLTSPKTQLGQLAANALRAPESVICCHFLDQADRLGREPRLSRVCLRFVLRGTRGRAHDASLRKVSGCTMKSACFQVRTILARNTKRNRSECLHAGRLTCRRRMMSCWRSNAFATRSSDFPLARSAIIPSRRGAECGFVQRTIPSWSA
jgi:hypothetical protein